MELKLADLNAGWIEVVVLHAGNSVRVEAAWTSNAPADLAIATIALLEGREHAQCVWDCYAHHFEWRLMMQTRLLEVRIVKTDGLDSQITEFRVALLEWATAVQEFLQHLVEQFSPEEYFERWKQFPLPWEEYGRLSELIQEKSAVSGA